MFTEPKRRLLAILSADVVGYSRLMGEDDAGTLAMLNAARTVFREHVEAHTGRIVDTAGDSVLAVFDSVVEAVDAAVEIQDEMLALNAERAPQSRMLFRIGINLGDVLEQTDGTVYGDGVNIAARLEALAEAGGLCVSGQAYDFVRDRGGINWQFLGEQEVKNIARPLRAYRSDLTSDTGGSAINTSSTAGASSGVEAITAQQLPARPSIAVLPFANMGSNTDDEYFADGISEDIITELSRFRDLIVTARNSTFVYKGRAVDAQDVGRELNVRYILEGSVRKAGDRVRVTAQLIEAESGHHLWAERYDRRLEDVFAVQDELTRRIVSTLVGRLIESERKRARTEVDHENAAAYDLVLRGRELWFKFNREDNLAARGLYLQAIKVDPEYPRAYAGLAWTYSMAYNEYWTDDPKGSLEKAYDYAQRAVHMDPSSHSFWLCLGMVYFFKKNLARAIECFEKAIELNVNDADSYSFLSQALSLNGEPDKAIKLLDHAFEINPYLGDWPRSLYGLAHFIARRYDEAVSVINNIVEPSVSNSRWFAAVYGALDEPEKAAPYVKRYLAAYPDFDFDEHICRVPFRLETDREHYAESLKRAGFEQKTATVGCC